MKLCHAAALALVGWYLNSGRSGKGRPNRPARDGNRRERVRAPGKANTPPDASLSQIESEKIIGGHCCAKMASATLPVFWSPLLDGSHEATPRRRARPCEEPI